MYRHKHAFRLLLIASFISAITIAVIVILSPGKKTPDIHYFGHGASLYTAVNTGARPEVIETSPVQGEKMARLYQSIEITLNRKASSVSVKVFNKESKDLIPGKTSINKNKVSFIPSGVFLPGKTYTVIIRAESKEHVKMEDRFSFTTVTMGEKIWVEVELGERHCVTVYKGSDIFKRLPASGGLPESPTPTGYFYTQDRGYSFWSPRFSEGATYWVRLAGQILVHSVPRDGNWKTKEEEHAKLGLPASHGCIRLDEQDARWFFENIPQRTLVIIHR